MSVIVIFWWKMKIVYSEKSLVELCQMVKWALTDLKNVEKLHMIQLKIDDQLFDFFCLK